MNRNRNLGIAATMILGLASLSFAQKAPVEQTTNQPAMQESDTAAKTICGCGHMMDSKDDSARGASKETTSREVSNACKEAIAREAEAAKESLVRWR